MYIDRLILLFIVGAYALSPALMQWWVDGGVVWYRPFLIWGLLIGITLWIARSRDLDGT